MPNSIESLIDSFGNAHCTLEQKDATVVKLCGLGAGAVGPLMEAIEVSRYAMKPDAQAETDTREAIVQLYAARTLGLLGKRAARAASALADLFAKSRTSLIRREAAIALARIGPVQDAATNADVVYLMTSVLSGIHEHWHVDVREAAVIALGAFGPVAKNAVTQLLPCLMDRSERVREAAFQAMVKLGPISVPILRDALRERTRLRTDLATKGTIVLGAWAMHFAAGESDHDKADSVWHVRKRTEDCAFLEKIFESGVQILAKLDPASAEFRTILNEIAKADGNPKLQALAKDALAKTAKRG